MPIELTMPRLSDTMESGTILKWNVKEGDAVSSGSVVADVETDKATMEMQAFDDGVVARILVQEGESVPVGTPIAIIAEENEDPKQVAAAAGSASTAEVKPKTAEREEPSRRGDVERDDQVADSAGSAGAREKQSPRPVEAGREADGATGRAPSTPDRPRPAVTEDADAGDRLRVSPVARRLADDHGIDIRRIRGSGPNGRVVKEDVLSAIEGGAAGGSGGGSAGGPAPATRGGIGAPVGGSAMPAAGGRSGVEAKIAPLSSMRQTIARRLVESKTTIPHYQVTMRFDMEALLSLRQTLNEQLASQDVKLSVNDFLVRACALAILEHPEFNASWAGAEGLRFHGAVNVGVAISLPRERGGGLVVGVIRDADRKGLRQISAEAKSLAERARGRGLSAEDMSDATFTISNLGMYGVEHFTAIINPPNSAILAVGAAVEKPVVRDGEIVVGREMQMTMSSDHRVIDGAMAAEYLQTVKRLLEAPATLLV